MSTKSIKLYHLFLLVVVINFAAFYAFIGYSQLDTNNSKDINYLIATSVAIVIIWFVYYLFRHKLTSRRLLWLHLLVVVTCILIIPSMTTAYLPTPRRYLELDSQGFKLSGLFGTMTTALVIQVALLAISIAFLFFNIKGNKRITSDQFLEAV